MLCVRGSEVDRPLDATSHHDHGDGGDLIARAERVCAERRLQLTPWRRRVLEELARTSSPLGAYDLVERLAGERRISPISVYRALDFLMAAGLVHRIAARNTYLPCHHEHQHDETTVFLICSRCGAVDERTSLAVAEGLDGTAQAAGFQVQSRSVELEGQCGACRSTG